MKLYAIARPLPRGRVLLALIAGSSGYFKFDTYAHVGYLGVCPTGFKADTVTVEVDANIIDATSPADVGSLTRRTQSSAMSIINVTPVEFAQKGDTNEIVIPRVDRPSNQFILFVDITGR